MIQKIILHNPSKSDIVDYKIAEAELNSDGDVIWDTMTGTYKGTGVTLEWTILAGETKSFPKYVAEYLKKIYDFLEVKEETEPTEESTNVIIPEASPTTGNVSCKYCGMNFKNEKGLALHIAHKHPEKIL